VDDQRIGRVLRALRHKKGWRQADVAQKAGISQTVISNLEIGEIGSLSIATFREIAVAVGAQAVVSLKWRGADLDRLLDEGHAAVVGAVVGLLAKAGWEIHPEVSFSVYGERGSIDVLAWHAPSRTLLVVEVKTELVSLEETIRKLDVKIRLAPEVAAERFGWKPAFRSHLLVLPDTSTQRRRVALHAAVLDLAMPVRGEELRAWIKAPDRSVGGVLFVSLTTGAGTTRGGLSRKRIRLTRAEADERGPELADDSDGAKHN
jgi:transcriptional regulator with XRE-family HTH domain